MTAVHSTIVIFFYIQLIACVTSQADIANGKTVGHVLTDGKDNTCRDYTGGTGSVTVNLPESYPFTWLRVHVNTTEAVGNLQVAFNNTVSCNNPRSAPVDGQTWDIYCSMDEFVQSVTLTGPAAASLCSIYISGGRDIAINETAQQTSTWLTYPASLSVDGNVNPDFFAGHCSITMGSKSTQDSWSVTFSQSRIVNRYAIYNRDDASIFRLQGFSLQSFNGSTGVFNYTNSRAILPVYTVKHGHLHITSVQITSGNSDKILQMCEMEIYGDSICAHGQYGRDCELTCNCDGGQPCFVSTGGCPSGCASGYHGENCSIPCSPGKYGLGCLTNCSEFCTRDTLGVRSCARFNGSCNLGCEGGYSGSKCTLHSICAHGQYGRDCELTCNCDGGQPCFVSTGGCPSGCASGYHGENCSIPCSPGKYGLGCLTNCSEFCTRDTLGVRSCDRFNGSCNLGCEDGYSESKCTLPCEREQYGRECINTCSQQCANQTTEETSCDHVNGTCRFGCKAGYKELLCRTPCEAGKYGPGCGYNCSSICVSSNTTDQSSCHHVTGICMFGCLGGYDAMICEQVSDYEIPADADNRQLIGIIVGCLLGVIIVAVIIAAGIIVFRRRQTTKSETHVDESRDISLSRNDHSETHRTLSADDGYEIPELSTAVTQRATQIGPQRKVESEDIVGDDSVAHTYDDRVAHTYEEICDNLASPYEAVGDDNIKDITHTHNCPERRQSTKSETHGDESRDISQSRNDRCENHRTLSADDGYEIPELSTAETQRATQIGPQRKVESEDIVGDDSVAHTCEDRVAHTYEEIGDNLASPYETVGDDNIKDITLAHNCPEYANTL